MERLYTLPQIGEIEYPSIPLSLGNTQGRKRISFMIELLHVKHLCHTVKVSCPARIKIAIKLLICANNLLLPVGSVTAAAITVTFCKRVKRLGSNYKLVFHKGGHLCEISKSHKHTTLQIMIHSVT